QKEQPPADLNVSLSANPYFGTAPLNNISLTAKIFGTATGPINYTFYCERADTGKNITTPYDAKYDNISETTKTASNLCNYSTPGTHVAKVIVERDNLSAEARTNIVVNPSQEVCQDVDQDGVADYDSRSCPSGKDQCIEKTTDLARERLEQYIPTSSLFEITAQPTTNNLFNFEIKKTKTAEIKFKTNLNLLQVDRNNGCFAKIDLDTVVQIEDRKIKIDSLNAPNLNAPAEIIFYNITFSNPVIKKDGVLCSQPQCKIKSYDKTNHILIVEVNGFSEYTIEEGGTRSEE
ncbi:MAG: hypothetical protein ACPLY7_02385, partial [Microgenomates group bacterium]